MKTQERSDRATTIDKILSEGAVALRSGRVSEAEGIARKMLAGHPRHPDALELLGMTLLAQGKPLEAIEPLRDAAQLNPSAVVETHLGTALRRTGRVAEALAILRQASERQPAVSNAFFELGMLLYEQRRVAEAEAVLNRGMAIAPGEDLSLALGTIFADRGDLDNASVAFARVLAAEPGQPGALHGLGWVRMERGEFDRAREKLREAMARDPSDTRAQLMMASCLFELGRPGEAIACLRTLLASAPQLFGGALKTCVEAGKGRLWLKPSAAAESLGLKRV
jgi:tetratricopeptide (TPR) repeat protein